MPVRPRSLSIANRLLSLLPDKEYRRLIAKGEEVGLELEAVLYEPKRPIPYVYFMLEGMASVVTTMEDGSTIEVLIVGREGMVGLPALESATRTTPPGAFMQIQGRATKLASHIVREEFNRGGSLQQQILRYFQFAFVQVSQSAACNRLHNLEERLARWLLMVQDRVNSDQFVITHEFLAQMLGTRRSSVTLAAGVLQRAGFIRYQRGEMQLLNRNELQNVACECYGNIQESWDQLMGTPSNSLDGSL